MRLILALSALVGVWFQADEFSSGAINAKLQTIRDTGRAGVFLIHFAATPNHAAWMDALIAGLPDNAQLMYTCSSFAACEAAMPYLPARVEWIAYDLETWANSAGEHERPFESVQAVADLAHAHGRKLMFMPATAWIYSERRDDIPALAALVDGWTVQGQAFMRYSMCADRACFTEKALDYRELIRAGNPTAPVLLQLRLPIYLPDKGRYNTSEHAVYTAEGLYGYWQTVSGAYDGVLILDASDDLHPDAAQHRPLVYRQFATGQWIRAEYVIEPRL